MHSRSEGKRRGGEGRRGRRRRWARVPPVQMGSHPGPGPWPTGSWTSASCCPTARWVAAEASGYLQGGDKKQHSQGIEYFISPTWVRHIECTVRVNGFNPNGQRKQPQQTRKETSDFFFFKTSKSPVFFQDVPSPIRCCANMRNLADTRQWFFLLYLFILLFALENNEFKTMNLNECVFFFFSVRDLGTNWSIPHPHLHYHSEVWNWMSFQCQQSWRWTFSWLLTWQFLTAGIKTMLEHTELWRKQ